jgi:dTMP kinase
MTIKQKGKFIVFEGIDGCGKSTQVAKLYDFLNKKGRLVIKTREHQRQGIGLFIEDVLNGKKKIDPLALEVCFIADRCDHSNQVIGPNLEAGKIILCDRYYWSTVAYSHSQYRSWMLEVNRKIGIKPDLVIFIDTKPKTAMERIGKGRSSKTIFEKEKKLEKIRKRYQWLIKNDPVKKIVIDGNRQVGEIFEEILDKLGYGRNI